MAETRCYLCRGHVTDVDHLEGCPALVPLHRGREKRENALRLMRAQEYILARIPPGWTFIEMRQNRRDSRQVKPHYRTAPAVIRTRVTPDMFTTYARIVARKCGIDEDEAAEAAMYIAYGRRAGKSTPVCSVNP